MVDTIAMNAAIVSWVTIMLVPSMHDNVDLNHILNQTAMMTNILVTDTRNKWWRRQQQVQEYNTCSYGYSEYSGDDDWLKTIDWEIKQKYIEV